MNEYRWKSLKSLKINENIVISMNIIEISININEKQWKSMKINGGSRRHGRSLNIINIQILFCRNASRTRSQQAHEYHASPRPTQPRPRPARRSITEPFAVLAAVAEGTAVLAPSLPQSPPCSATSKCTEEPSLAEPSTCGSGALCSRALPCRLTAMR